MAEVFGAVASAIGVVGVAAQCADGIRKLREFCKDVENAPEELTYMANELELLTHTIDSLERQIHRNSSVAVGINPIGALRFCQRSVQTTACIIQALNVDIAKRRAGPLRAAWKKKTLEGYMTRIERAKSSLALSYSAYTCELNQQDFIATQRHVGQRFDQLHSAVVTFSQCIKVTSAQPEQPRNRSTQLSTVAWEPDQIVSNLEDSSETDTVDLLRTTSRRSQTPVQIARLHFRLPQWIYSRSIELDVQYVARAWTIRLNPRRLVPRHTDFFNACMDFDIGSMREQLQGRTASVYDVDQSGLNALHYMFIDTELASGMQIPYDTYNAAVEFLLEHGTDIYALDDYGHHPTELLLHCRPALAINVYRKILHHHGTMPSVGDTSLSALYHEYIAVAKGEIPWHRISVNALIDSFTSQTFRWSDDVFNWFGCEDWDKLWVRISPVHRKRLINYILSCYILALSREDRQAWGKTIRNALSQIGHLSLMSESWIEYWTSFSTSAWISEWPMYVNRSSFAEDVLTCGAGYLTAEKLEQLSLANPLKHAPVTTRWSPSLCDGVTFDRIMFMNTSLRAKEWKIWTDTPLDQWAGEFWDMIEHPERAVPGAWGFDLEDEL